MKVVYYLKFENDERNFNDFFKMDSHAKRNISKISTALSPGCYFLLDANDKSGLACCYPRSFEMLLRYLRYFDSDRMPWL